MHLYEIDYDHLRATRAATGESVFQCVTCKGEHGNGQHFKHKSRNDCKDRYGNGTPGCPACDAEADKYRNIEGCKTSPYSFQCGSAWSNQPTCACGRQQSTD